MEQKCKNQKHVRKITEMVCQRCHCFICSHCIKEHHSDEHSIIDFEDYYHQIFKDDSKQELNDQLIHLNLKKQQNQSDYEVTLKHFTSQLDHIDRECRELVNEINYTKTTLIQTLKNKYIENQDLFTSHQNEIDTKIDLLLKRITSTKSDQTRERKFEEMVKLFSENDPSKLADILECNLGLSDGANTSGDSNFKNDTDDKKVVNMLFIISSITKLRDLVSKMTYLEIESKVDISRIPSDSARSVRFKNNIIRHVKDSNNFSILNLNNIDQPGNLENIKLDRGRVPQGSYFLQSAYSRELGVILFHNQHYYICQDRKYSEGLIERFEDGSPYTPRKNQATIEFEKKVYLFGGSDQNDSDSGSSYEFDLSERVARRLPSIPQGFESSHINLSVDERNRLIYILGNIKIGDLYRCYVLQYNIESKSYKKIFESNKNIDYKMCGCYVPKTNSIYILSHKHFHSYSIDTKEFEDLTAIPVINDTPLPQNPNRKFVFSKLQYDNDDSLYLISEENYLLRYHLGIDSWTKKGTFKFNFLGFSTIY